VEIEDLALEVELEGGAPFLRPLPLARLARCEEQVLERGDFRPEIAVALHRCAPARERVAWIQPPIIRPISVTVAAANSYLRPLR
jgi:hypothetical protein